MKPSARLLPRLLLLGALAALHAGAGAAEDMVMEIVPLSHRLAGDVLPTLRELVAPGGTVTGMNAQVILRTTPANLADLKRVLATLDTRARQLRITVRQDMGATNQWRDDALAAQVRSGGLDARVGALPPPGTPGVGIDIGGDEAALAYRHYGTQGTSDEANTHFVTTVEGSPAYINTGQVVPLPSQTSVWTPWGPALQQGFEYAPVGAGFYVTPRVAGEMVQLEVSPYADRLHPAGGGAIDARGLTTTASGRLGEWIPLGGATAAYTDAQGEVLASTRRQGSDRYDVWVKVEVVP